MVTDSSDRDGGPQPVGTDGGHSLLTRVFGSLSDPRRRGVLYYLRDSGQADVEDLACALAAWEREVACEDVAEEVSQRVRADLRHVHLPKLEDYRIVDFDARSGTVSYGHPPDVLEDVIDIAATVEDQPPCR